MLQCTKLVTTLMDNCMLSRKLSLPLTPTQRTSPKISNDCQLRQRCLHRQIILISSDITTPGSRRPSNPRNRSPNTLILSNPFQNLNFLKILLSSFRVLKNPIMKGLQSSSTVVPITIQILLLIALLNSLARNSKKTTKLNLSLTILRTPTTRFQSQPPNLFQSLKMKCQSRSHFTFRLNCAQNRQRTTSTIGIQNF